MPLRPITLPAEIPLPDPDPNPIKKVQPPIALTPRNAPLAQRVAEKTFPVATQVNYAWMKFQFGRVAVYLLALSFCWLTIWFRLYSYFHHKSFHDQIEAARIQKLQSSLEVIIGGNVGATTQQETALSDKTIDSLSERELRENIQQCHAKVSRRQDPEAAAQMARATFQIREKIRKLSQGEFVWGGVEELRREIGEVMKMKIYQDLENYQGSEKGPKDCFAVNFLQVLAVKFIAVDGTEALSAYGKKCLEAQNGKPFAARQSFSPKELADQLSGYLNKPSFSTDGGLSWLFWAAAHPRKAAHSLHSKTYSLQYNANEGNPSFSAYTYSAGGKQSRFYYGPGPTGDALIEHGLLPACKRFQTSVTLFNHQDSHKKDDHIRISKIHRMEQRHPAALRHAMIGFDKAESTLSPHFGGVQGFFSQYRKYITKDGAHRKIGGTKDDNGFYIPQSLLDDRQVDAALDAAQEFCTRLSKDNPYWQEMMSGGDKGRVRAVKVMQLITDVFLTLAMTYTSLDQISPEEMSRIFDKRLDQDLCAFYASGACKQDVDRAIVENIILRLFFRWSTNPALLTKEEVYEIVGAVLGRARLVDDRNIQWKRYQIIDDVLRFIGSQEGVRIAHEILSGYQESILAPPRPQKEEVQEKPNSWFSPISAVWHNVFGSPQVY